MDYREMTDVGMMNSLMDGSYFGMDQEIELPEVQLNGPDRPMDPMADAPASAAPQASAPAEAEVAAGVPEAEPNQVTNINPDPSPQPAPKAAPVTTPAGFDTLGLSAGSDSRADSIL